MYHDYKGWSLNILEGSNFNLRYLYVRLFDLDIPREKWLNYLHTVETQSDASFWGI